VPAVTKSRKLARHRRLKIAQTPEDRCDSTIHDHRPNSNTLAPFSTRNSTDRRRPGHESLRKPPSLQRLTRRTNLASLRVHHIAAPVATNKKRKMGKTYPQRVRLALSTPGLAGIPRSSIGGTGLAASGIGNSPRATALVPFLVKSGGWRGVGQAFFRVVTMMDLVSTIQSARGNGADGTAGAAHKGPAKLR